MGYDFEQIKDSPFVIDATWTSLGCEFGVKVSESEGLGRVTLCGETALDGLGNGGGVWSNGWGHSTGENTNCVAERIGEIGGVRVNGSRIGGGVLGK